MRIYERTSVFGWQGDGGIGERLIGQILAGTKTATNCPKVLYSADELEQLHASVGHHMTVTDRQGRPRCNILQVAVFETTFGTPDPRLIHGEGCLTADEFRRAHLHVWDEFLEEAGEKLSDHTVLVAEIFKLSAVR